MAAWVPTDLGSVLLGWWEARDLVGSLADGAAVASWPDKSTYGRTLTQATASRQPTFRNPGRHGVPSIRSDGGDVLTNTALGSPFNGLAGGYVSFLFSTAAGNTHRYVASAPNAVSGNGADLGLNDTGVLGNLRSNTGAVGSAVSSLSWGDGDLYLAEASWDFSKATNDLTITGGYAVPVSTSVAGATTAAAFGQFNLLNFSSGFSAGYVGDLYAAIICDRALTADEVDDWRHYIVREWDAVTQHIDMPTVGSIGFGMAQGET